MKLNVPYSTVKIRSFSLQAAKTLFFTFILLNFGYCLINGKNGVFSYLRQSAKLEIMEKHLSEVEDKRTKLVNKVYKLHPSTLDADLLDEQFRRATGKVKSNEVVYYYE